MTGTKVLLILLILMVVLFVVLVAWGVLKEPSKTTWHTFKQDSWYPVVSNLDLFGSPPKLKPTELTPNPPPLRRLQPGARVSPGEFILRAGDQPATFDVSPDSHNQRRLATFSVTREGCAAIQYTNFNNRAGKLRKQSWPKDPETGESTVDPNNPTKVTFQVLSAKGQLTITFTPLQQGDCAVQLK
jgi:hypothetical protein